MTHMLIVGYSKVATACKIRVVAHYPQSGKALPRDSDTLIDVTRSFDEVDCPKCLQSVGLERRAR
jgi:hypothetical protein